MICKNFPSSKLGLNSGQCSVDPLIIVEARLYTTKISFDMDSTAAAQWGSKLLVQVLAAFFLLHFTVHWLLYLVFGVWTGLFNPFNLSVNKCHFRNGSTRVDIRQIKVRVPPFSDRGKLFSIKLLGVVVDCKTDKPKHKSKPKAKRPLKEENHDDDTSLDTPFCIYPTDPKHRRLVRFLLRVCPIFSVTLVDLELLLPNSTDVQVSSLSLSINSRSISHGWLDIWSPFSKNADYQLKSSVRIEDTGIYQEKPIAQISEQHCNAQFNINLDTGDASEFQWTIGIGSAKLSLLQLTAALKKRSHKPSDATLQPEPEQASDKPYSAETHRTFYRMSAVIRLLSEAEITLDQLLLQDIPIPGRQLVHGPNMTTKFLGQINMHSLNLNLSKLLPEDVGYDLRYDSNDVPLQLMLSVLSLKMAINFSDDHWKPTDIASISTFTIKTHSTALTELLQLVVSNKKPDDTDMLKTIVTLMCTVTGLTVDMNAQQLGTLVSHCAAYKKDEKASVHKPKSKHTKKRIWQVYREYLEKSFPWIILKVLVEQPVFMIKSKGNGNHMLVMTPSMCNLEVGAQKKRAMSEIEARLDMPNFNVDYRRQDEAFFQRVACLKDTQLKATYRQIGNDSKLSLFQEFSFLDINLTEVICLNGISTLVNAVTDATNLPEHKSSESKSGSHLIFNNLPDCVDVCRLQIQEISIKLGARSIFMPLDVLKANHLPEDIAKQFTANGNYIGFHQSRAMFEINNCKPAQDHHYWSTAVNLDDIKVIGHYSMGTQKEIAERARILTIPDFKGELMALKEPQKLLLKGRLPTLNFKYSLAAHFLVCSSVYLIKNTLLDLNVLPKKTYDPKAPHKPIKYLRTKIINALALEISIQECQTRYLLADGFRMRADALNISVDTNENPVTVQGELIRVAVLTGENQWTRVMGVSDLSALFDWVHCTDKRFDVFTNKIIVNVPYDFVVYELFEGWSATYKVMHQMDTILKTNQAELSLRPHAHEPQAIYGTDIRAKTLSVLFEDDKFETDLAMIYQLGLVEQKSRMAKMKDFQKYLKGLKAKMKDNESFCAKIDVIINNPWTSTNDYDLKEINDKFNALKRNLAETWITEINEFKLRRKQVVDENITYLNSIGLETSPCTREFNANLTDFRYEPALFSVFFDDIKVSLRPPKVDKDADIMHFVNRVGDGFPLDSEFAFFYPFHIKMRTNRMRVHIRDYPIPTVYITRSSSYNIGKTFSIEGDVCFLEQLAKADYQLRHVYTTFLPGCVRGENDKYLAENVPRSITTMKFLAELVGHVKTDEPTIFTWGESITGALRQLDHTFALWCKSKTDPSPSLGLWDNMRNSYHGFIRIFWDNPTSDVRFNLKGSMDPYEVLSDTAGFSLCFKDEVCMHINDPTREFERDVMTVTSKRALWVIPNYLSQPLPCWCSPKLVFLPASKSQTAISTMYGYYLNRKCYFDSASDVRSLLGITHEHDYLKECINLSGDITIKLSMMLQRRLPNGTLTSEFKPHYRNVTRNPKFVEDIEHYDAYEGFRSNYIHMAFTLRTRNSQMNSIHLSPRAWELFREWFDLFDTSVTTPVKKGKLFRSHSSSVKFSRHLMTFKYLFDLSPLYLFHGYRLDLTDPDTNKLIGLKARMDKFEFDIHQRKELMMRQNTALDKKTQFLEMKFYLGAMSLTDVDIRLICIDFKQKANDTDSIASHSYQFDIFDNDEDWIDIDDYSEIDLPDLSGCDLKGSVLPLMHSTVLNYSIKRDGTSEFGHEDSHECQLDKFKFTDTTFNNVLDAQDINVKWNREIRDALYQYGREVQLGNSYMLSTNFKAMNSVKDKIQLNTQEQDKVQEKARVKFDKLNRPTEANFEKEIRETGDYLPNLVPIDHLLIQLTKLQVQMINTDSADFMMLLYTPNINLNVIQICDKTLLNIVHSSPYEMRVGTIFKSADLFIVYKKDIPEDPVKAYGSETCWPIFETDDKYRDILERNRILSNVRIIARYDYVLSAIENDQKRNKIYLDVPTFETKIDSDALLSFVSLIQNLLIYTEPEMKKLNSTVRKMVLATDFSDLHEVFDRSADIRERLSALYEVRNCLEAIRYTRKEAEFYDHQVREEISKLTLEAFVYLRALMSGSQEITADDSCKYELLVTAEQFTINLMVESRKFLTLNIGDCVLQRLELQDGTTKNKFKVGTISALNRDDNILYPNLLTEYDPPSKSKHYHGITDDMLEIVWAMDKPVGGIRVVTYMNVSFHPIQLEIEEKTGLKLMRFVFPQGSNSANLVNELSTVKNLSRTRKEEEESNSSDSEDEEDSLYPDANAFDDTMNIGSEDSGVDEMVSRANKYFSINQFTLNQLTIRISISAKGMLRAMNVNNFVFDVPPYHIDHRIMTMYQLVHAIEAHVAKSLMRHSGKLIRNKLFHGRKRIASGATDDASDSASAGETSTTNGS